MIIPHKNFNALTTKHVIHYINIMPRLKNGNHEKLARVIAKELISNEGQVNQTLAYQKVYQHASYNSARATAPVVLAIPCVKERIQDLVLAHNPPEEISKDLANLRRADKEILNSDGEIIEVRDNPTRLGAVALCLKVSGIGNGELNINNNTLNINITPDEILRLEAIAKTFSLLTDRIDARRALIKSQTNNV